MTKCLHEDGDGGVAEAMLKENAMFVSAAFHRSMSTNLRNGFLANIVAAPGEFSHWTEGSQLRWEEEGQDQNVDALLSNDGGRNVAAMVENCGCGFLSPPPPTQNPAMW